VDLDHPELEEKRTKHCDDLENAKLIPSILLDYIPTLAGTVSCDNVPRDFDYTLITVYLPKGICTGGQIMALNISEFNLGDCKNHGMLAPHKYLTRNKENKSKIIPQMWNMDIVSSIILNVMKITHFGRN
jgi:hypothetical protein